MKNIKNPSQKGSSQLSDSIYKNNQYIGTPNRGFHIDLTKRRVQSDLPQKYRNKYLNKSRSYIYQVLETERDREPDEDDIPDLQQKKNNVQSTKKDVLHLPEANIINQKVITEKMNEIGRKLLAYSFTNLNAVMNDIFYNMSRVINYFYIIITRKKLRRDSVHLRRLDLKLILRQPWLLKKKKPKCNLQLKILK